MIDPLLKLFNIGPDYDFNLMEENQSLEYITVSVLGQVTDVIKQEKARLYISPRGYDHGYGSKFSHLWWP